MFYDVFVSLCNKKGVSKNKALTDCSISRTSVARWEKGAIPRGVTLQKLAEYFGVTTDYLLNGEGKKNAPACHSERTLLSSEEIIDREGISDQIINACRQLNEAGQERVALYAEDLVSSGRYQKEETLPLVARGGETIEISEPVDAEAIKKADEEHPPVYPPEL